MADAFSLCDVPSLGLRLAGSAGPWTTASSSLSAPKLVMNVTGAASEDLDLDLEREGERDPGLKRGTQKEKVDRQINKDHQHEFKLRPKSKGIYYQLPFTIPYTRLFQAYILV